MENQGKEGTPTPVTQAAGQTPTPQAPPATNPDPVEELRRENEQLKKQTADKDKHINDLQLEKNTLEARLTQTAPKSHTQSAPALDGDLQKEAATILEEAQVDPQKAGERLAGLISKAASRGQQELLQNIEPIINQNAYVSKVKSENQDLIDLGLEPNISFRAQQLMNSGKQFKDAIDTAIKESREKVDKLKQSNAPVPPTPPPAGSVGESGANNAPAPTPPPIIETDADEIASARERRRKLGL